MPCRHAVSKCLRCRHSLQPVVQMHALVAASGADAGTPHAATSAVPGGVCCSKFNGAGGMHIMVL